MTDSELRDLFEAANRRFEELTRKHEMGFGLTRRECDEMRRCTARLGVIAREMWLQLGQPDAPEFAILREPIKLSSIPKSMRAIDLTDINSTEVH